MFVNIGQRIKVIMNIVKKLPPRDPDFIWKISE
jgi:hypothetical protein